VFEVLEADSGFQKFFACFCPGLAFSPVLGEVFYFSSPLGGTWYGEGGDNGVILATVCTFDYQDLDTVMVMVFEVVAMDFENHIYLTRRTPF